MNITDLINGGFECVGIFFIIPSIIKTIKDKEVKGVNWLTVAFFTIWGIWNLIFYPINGLIFSFIGGIGIGVSNLVWAILLIYYKYFYKPKLK